MYSVSNLQTCALMHHLQVCSKISGYLQKFRTWSKFQEISRQLLKFHVNALAWMVDHILRKQFVKKKQLIFTPGGSCCNKTEQFVASLTAFT